MAVAPSRAETGREPGEEPTLGIIVSLQTAVSPAVIEEMQLETARILRPVGLRLEWRFGYNDAHGESFNHLVSVKIRGNCNLMMPHASAVRLGLTHITDGDILPYCELDCAAVAFMIQPVIRREGFGRGAALLGRSLARVLGHEIYHVLARTRHHGRDGLAKPSLATEDLICDHLHFDMPQLEAMRASVSRTATGRSAKLALPNVNATGILASR